MTVGADPSMLEQIRVISQAAGDAILEVYSSAFDVELKDDHSPLTDADRVSHAIIVEGLHNLYPSLPILSEESPPEDLSDRASWVRYWLVDPLDGTKEFIKRNGEFTVNIALIDAHEPVLGVVLAPALGREYSALLGHGAFRRDADGDHRPIEVCREAGEQLRIVSSRSHAAPALAAYLDAIGPHELKPMGSSLKICLVAEGAADVYPRLGPTSEWDTAAAQAILISAGGSMIDLAGQPLTYNSKEHLLNPHFVAFGDCRRDWLAPIRNS